jgi:hypothetical protein
MIQRAGRRRNISRALLPFGAIVLFGVLLMAYVYGRSLWHPYYVRIKGPRTVEEVIESIRGEEHVRALGEKIGAEEIRELVLICIKEKRRLELWANGRHIKTYWMTAYSGRLGPKRAEGDGQIPEGIYRANFLNPNSAYRLSIQIDYPNRWDRAWAKEEERTDLGGEIFIHGKDVSIGCIAIGDRNIEELFYLVHRAGLRRTKVIVSPFDFRISDFRIESDAKVIELYGHIKAELARYKRIGPNG